MELVSAVTVATPSIGAWRCTLQIPSGTWHSSAACGLGCFLQHGQLCPAAASRLCSHPPLGCACSLDCWENVWVPEPGKRHQQTHLLCCSRPAAARTTLLRGERSWCPLSLFCFKRTVSSGLEPCSCTVLLPAS